MKKSGRAPCTRMSFTQWLTISCPTVSCFFIMQAILSFVPTPSVEATSRGSFIPCGRRQSPPNDPMPPATFTVLVEPTMALMAFRALILLSMFTPAAA